jgi:excisionase family DNA binding protein
VEAHEALDAIAHELATAPASSPPDALTTVQVAAALCLGRATVAEMLRRGEIASVKIGGARRVFRADLDRYIAELRASAVWPLAAASMLSNGA